MTYLIGLLFIHTSIFQPGYDHQIVDQASQYLNNIENSVNISESYWALNELFSSTCSNNNLVIREIINSRVQEAKYYFSNTECGSITTPQNDQFKLARTREIALGNGFYSLSVNYLLNQANLEERGQFYDEFIRKWDKKFSPSDLQFLNSIVSRTELTIDSIPDIEKELVLFSFLYAKQFNEYFEEIKPQNLISELLTDFEKNYSSPSLKKAIQLTNIIRISFEYDANNVIQNLLPSIKENIQFPISESKTTYLNATRYSLYSIGRFDQSLDIIRNHIIPLAEYLGMDLLKDEMILEKGTNLYSLGKFKEAKDVFETLYTDTSSKVNKTELFANLSLSHLKLGEKNKYVELHLDALESARQDTLYKSELIILRNLFITYTKNRDEDNALYYLKLAEEIAAEEEDLYELASIHAFSATFQWEFYKNASRALSEIELAKEQYSQIADYIDYISVLNEEARILTAIDSLSAARLIYEEIKELALERSNSPDYIEALVGLTEIALRKNNLNKAAGLLDEIRIYPLNDLDFSVAVKYNTVKAWYLKEVGSNRVAYEEFIPIIDQIADRARNSIDTQSGTWTIEEEYIQAYNLIVGMLIDFGHHPKAIQLMDELKTINDAALYNSPILRAQRLSEEDLAEDKILSDDIQKLRNEYLNASSITKRFEIDREIDRLSAQREEIISGIRSEMDLNKISVWQAQRKLHDDELILHFTEIGEELYISTITKELSEIHQIHFDSETKQLFMEAANRLASSETDLNLLHEVYKVLQLERNIPENIQQLIVIPDNHLYRIPLGVLPTHTPSSRHSYGNTRYLIEDYPIKYYTSLNELLSNNRYQNKRAAVDFSAFALSDFSSFESINLPSLPFTTQEVRNIDSKLQAFENRSIYLENEATKDSFLREIQRSRVVHVATHSEVSEEDPLFSTIYLKSRDQQQSALYAYELFNERINSDLIMLNSCSSGSGGYMQGSGVVGISRALRYAGAKSLALNIWAVNDKSASEFATGFYEQIDNGAPKWLALQQAKLQLLETGNANPYYWGAYMLIGNPSPLTKKPANAGFLYSIFSFVIMVSAYMALTKRKDIYV